MSTTRGRRVSRVLVPVTLTLVAAALAVPTAFAVQNTAIGTISPSSVPAGTTNDTYTFTLTPTSGQVSSFNLTAASGWKILSLDTAPTGVTLASATQIQGRSLTSSSFPLSIGFTAQAPCASSNTTWGLAVKSGPNMNGSSFLIAPSSSLSTALSGTCSAAFVAPPADAAFNGNPKSENITSVPYTPSGDPITVAVKDAGGAARPGISITLQLTSPSPTSATLSGPLTATSDNSGIATFTGSSSNPISIDQVGLGYAMTPTGNGVTGTESGPFGIYQEGKQCPGGSCSVHGNSSNKDIDAVVSAVTQTGTLSVLVEEFHLDCQGYTPLSTSVIIWKYTGTGSQTVVATADKTLVQQTTDNGSSHLDVCYQTDNGKTFTDKFGNTGVTTGLLPNCSPTITTNCIVSETAGKGGDRVVTFTVEDGKGRM